MYKILSKLLANKLKKVLSYVIDKRQSVFIDGRNILQSVVIANEAIDEAKRYKKQSIFFKVDFEKAYDSVSWNYLLYMLRRLGFYEEWVGWINECLRTAMVSTLVNGSPSEEFTLKRGLRQGDPLTPFLFCMAAEGLIGLVRQAENCNLYSGLKVGRNNIGVSITQYADDTVSWGNLTLECYSH
uniref:Transposon TX1 uncharacterized n=1 Tax=Cajanus cajan TaxID=3821 RepID=A0A151RIN3_CAJCA|nr:Transposon TX1 uncharacterized [Cajanus cajan]